MQTFAEKIQAVESCLGILQEHLFLIAKVRTTLERVIPDSGGDAPLSPPPVPSDPHDPHYPPEAWERVLAGNVWRWRLGALSAALERLSDAKPLLATAVYLEFVEPDYLPEWNPGQREGWAAQGVAWIARDISGEMPFCERGARTVRAARTVRVRARTEMQRERDRRIKTMYLSGSSRHGIADALGCSHHTVKAVLNGQRVLHGRTVDG